MAAPKFSPVDPLDDARGYESPDHVPDEWKADRPGDLRGGQPTGTRLGYQGPDQGYGLLLANRLRGQLVLQPHEVADDAVVGCTAIGLRRASLFGRAPVIHDVRIAYTIWGYLDPHAPTELLEMRRPAFEGVSNTLHNYDLLRALVDSVPESTLRMRHGDVASCLPAELPPAARPLNARSAGLRTPGRRGP